MKEVIIYFDTGTRSVYYEVDNISWTSNTIYLDIYNKEDDHDDTVCISREHVSYILVKNTVNVM